MHGAIDKIIFIRYPCSMDILYVLRSVNVVFVKKYLINNDYQNDCENRCFQRVLKAWSPIVILFARSLECQLLSDVIVHRRHFLTSCDCTLPSPSIRSTCILHLCQEKKVVTTYQHYPPPVHSILDNEKNSVLWKGEETGNCPSK